MFSEVKVLFPSGLNRVKLALAPSDIDGFSNPKIALAAVSFSITISIGSTVNNAPKALSKPIVPFFQEGLLLPGLWFCEE